MSQGATLDARPIHQRIRSAIETRIMSGQLQPGDRIPFEHELMHEYDCSRMTVSKALSGLAAAGLIQRHRRAGSFVMQPRAQMAALKIPDMREEILLRGRAYALQLISRHETTAIVAGTGRQKQRSEPLLALRCLHLADGQPFAVEDRTINVAAVPKALQVDFAVTPPGSWLLEHVPWTEAEHRISAVSAGEYAALLGVTAERACLLLDRRTWRGKESITHVRTIFPGGDFDLTARFSSQLSTATAF